MARDRRTLPGFVFIAYAYIHMEGFRIDTLAFGYKEAVGVQHKLAKVGCTDLPRMDGIRKPK